MAKTKAPLFSHVQKAGFLKTLLIQSLMSLFYFWLESANRNRTEMEMYQVVRVIKALALSHKGLSIKFPVTT